MFCVWRAQSLPFQGRWLGEAEMERSSQICSNLSVSAAPSQHPYPFCPFGTFPPERGNRPLEGEPGEGEKTRLLGSSRGGHYIIMYHPLTVPSGLKTGSLPR